MHIKDDSELGFYEKFTVLRNDGRSEPGEKHHDCKYFVLDLYHDPFSVAALNAYADACQQQYPKLAEDLRLLANVSSVWTETGHAAEK